MADGILAAVNENGNIDRFIDTKGGVHYIEPKRYEESVAKIDAAATKAQETVNSATEAVSECKAQTGACTQETARAKEVADTVENRITGIEGDVATLRDSVSQPPVMLYTERDGNGTVYYRKSGGLVCIVVNFVSIEAKKGKKFGTLPAELRPDHNVIGYGWSRGSSNSIGQVTVDADGTVAGWCSIASTRYFCGSICYPLP